MGSRLEVETRPDWGTRFFFELELPLANPPVGADHTEERRAALPAEFELVILFL